MEIQDGRLQSFKPTPLQRNNESSSVLVQALETADFDLLDWCVENSEPPKEISLNHLAHLLTFLASRYWVYSQGKVLTWIHGLLIDNFEKMHRADEIRPVLEDLKSKLKAKTQGLGQVLKLKNKLQLVTNQNQHENYSVICEPQFIVNEEENS